MSSQVLCRAQEGIELRLEHGDGVSPTVRAGWCISDEIAEMLATRGVINPFVLIFVCVDQGERAPKRLREVDRFMFPLGQMMGHIPFHRSGPHRLFAAIVWDDEDDRPSEFLERDAHRRFTYSYFDDEKGQPTFHHDCKCADEMRDLDRTEKARVHKERVRLHLATIPSARDRRLKYIAIKSSPWALPPEAREIVIAPDPAHEAAKQALDAKNLLGAHNVILGKTTDVVVPDGYFAKEHSAWLDWWVNLWSSAPHEDSCQWFWRSVRAWTIQVVVVTVFAILYAVVGSLVALWHLLLARRGVKFSPIFHPFQENFADIYRRVGRSVLLCRKDGSRREIAPMLAPITPIVFLLVAGVGFVCFTFIEPLKVIPTDVKITTVVGTPFAMAVGVGAMMLVGLILKYVLLGIAVLLGWVLRPVGKAVYKWVLTPIGHWLDRKYDEWLAARAQVKMAKAVEVTRLAAVPAVSEAELRRRRLLEEFRPVLCKESPRRVAVAALPPERQTFWLKVADHKARTCRPRRK